MSEQINAIALDAVPASTEAGKHKLKLLIATMRPHQWSKNLFIFAPLLFAKKIGELPSVGLSLLAFAVFCCLASGLYILNDWLDIEEDRAHPEKRTRPLSSGELPLPLAGIGFVVLISGGLGLAWSVGWPFFVVATLYFALTLSYCVALKKVMILDCMTIAAGFVLRVVGGAVAINVAATNWLIACAFLLALFLAFSKRRQELLELTVTATSHRAVLSQYSVSFLGNVNIVVIAATIMCYALYTVSLETVDKFGTDKLIYGTGFVMYGLLRYMALIENPSNGGNPSKMLLRDLPLMLTVVAWGIYNAILIYQVAG